MHCVRCRTSRSRARNTTAFACCAASFTGTKRMPGRCAVYNGTLGTGFGQRFHAANDLLPPVAAAA